MMQLFRLATVLLKKNIHIVLAGVFAVCGGFFLLKWLSHDLHSAFAVVHWLIWPALAIVLVIIVVRSPGQVQSFAAYFLFAPQPAKAAKNARMTIAKIAVPFLILFAILLVKNAPYLQSQFEIRWHIAFLNFDLAWHTPIFALAGNILYQFDIQPAFNTSLAPLAAAAYLVGPGLRIIASFSLSFLAMSALAWAIGYTIGLRPVARAICAGSTALMTTIPYGLDHVLPFLPPPFDFSSEAMATTIFAELGLLSLAAVLIFFWIGQCRTFVNNLAVGLAFSAVTCVVLLSYPAFAFFSAPVVFFYCGSFLITAVNLREFWWKLSVGSALFLTMLATHIPLFFQNLYSYTYGAYFSDRIVNSASRLVILRNATILGVFWPEPRIFLIYCISLASAIFFIVRGNVTVRRFAIAMLTGEAGIAAIGAVMAYLHYPVSLFYSDQLQAPISIVFFLLALMAAFAVLARQGDEALKKIQEGTHKEGVPGATYRDRKNWYALGLLLFLAISPFLVPRERPFDNSVYPPGEPPSVQLMKSELGLRPGKPFAGRVFTLVGGNLPAEKTAGSDMSSLLISVLDVLENHYGRYTGNDHWNDLLNLNIPVFGEYAQWTTPINFVLLRQFFSRNDDVFQKSVYILRAYDERLARMMGIRYVVTDVAAIPGGTKVYERMTGDTPLRLFRIDGTNLGQYSPTQVIRIATAVEGLAMLKSTTFDPQRDVLVEKDLAADLVPGSLESLIVENGPTLHVTATSPGKSLLVLPFEYSRCLRLKASDGNTAQLIPVNLQQTGLLFEGHADIRIDYLFGPFANPACRGDDLARMNTLHVHDALK